MKKPPMFALIVIIKLLIQGTFGLAHSDYCIALRGNGELKPAHWGALAQTVEVFGVPKAMAGGSSASISTFLVESLLLNPHLSSDRDLRARDLSFLLKSFEGFVYTLTDRPEYQHFLEVLRVGQASAGGEGLIGRLNALVSAKSTSELLVSYRDIKLVLNEIIASEILYGPQVQAFHRAFKDYFSGFSTVLSAEKWRALRTEHDRLKLSLSVFGKFDAKNDQSIFVRDGIVNFSALVKVFDFMANFYSLRGAGTEASKAFNELLRVCAPGSEGKGWRAIVQGQPRCQGLLNESFQEYVKVHDSSRPRMSDKVGEFLPSLVATSVVVGNSRQRLVELKKQFLSQNHGNLEFQLPMEDLKFGYWGAKEDLTAIEKYFSLQNSELAAQIDKSKKFMSLGAAPWSHVLLYSPAEPGLSSFLPFQAEGEEMISLGGWSDLHPVPVLKALGCEKVVFVTRKGGESIFAQGIAKRLLGFPQLPWSELDPADTDENLTQAINNRGRLGNSDPAWSAMFNLANPMSSFSVSLQLADAVVCTDWNAFDVTQQFRELIDEAYQAPIFLAREMDLLSLKPPKLISREDNITISRLSKNGKPLEGQTYPRFAGCIPQGDLAVRP